MESLDNVIENYIEDATFLKPHFFVGIDDDKAMAEMVKVDLMKELHTIVMKYVNEYEEAFKKQTKKEGLNKMQKDKITINGIELNDKQVLMVKEAMNGHNEFGAQFEGYLESEEGLSIDEQSLIISSICDMF